MHPTVVVIPCYNEAQRLDVRRFEQFARRQNDVSLLFVDDGSRDRTLEVLHELVSRCPARLAVCRLARNCGKAEAVRQGFLRALDGGASLIGFWDADLATPLDAIDQFREVFARRPETQLVIGSRLRLLGRRIQRGRVRQLLGRVFACAASRGLGIGVRDTQCGAKMFRASAPLRRIFETPFVSSWIFDVEILARMICAGHFAQFGQAGDYVYELPLDDWREVAGSKLRPRDFLRAVYELAWIYRQYVLRGENATEEDTAGSTSGKPSETHRKAA